MIGEPYSQRIPAFSVKEELMRQSSVKKASYKRIAKVFIGIAERDGSRIGYTQQEVSEIRSAHCSRERKGSAAILLRQRIELLPLEIAAELESCGASDSRKNDADTALVSL